MRLPESGRPLNPRWPGAGAHACGRGRAAHCRDAPAAAAFYMGAAGMHAVGLMTKAFVVAPLAAFAAIVFGFAVYNTVCKNSHINLLNC